MCDRCLFPSDSRGMVLFFRVNGVNGDVIDSSMGEADNRPADSGLPYGWHDCYLLCKQRRCSRRHQVTEEIVPQHQNRPQNVSSRCQNVVCSKLSTAKQRIVFSKRKLSIFRVLNKQASKANKGIQRRRALYPQYVRQARQQSKIRYPKMYSSI